MFKVSVIIPVYNVEKYLEKCLQSVAAQTYGNIECVIVDDRGGDSSMRIAERFVSEYKGCFDFKIVRHEKNRGLSAARNTGVEASCGDYVYFLDSDDYLPNSSIETLAAPLENDRIDIVFGGATAFYGDGTADDSQTQRMKSSLPSGVPVCQPEILFYRISPANEVLGITAWNKLVGKKFFLENGLFFEEGLLHEDELWSFTYSLRAQSMMYIDEPTYFYRKREGSITTAPSLKNLHAMVRIANSWEALAAKEFSQRTDSTEALAVAVYCDRRLELLPFLFLPFGFSASYKAYRENLSGRKPAFPAKLRKSFPIFRKLVTLHRMLPAPLGFAAWYLLFKAKRLVIFMRRLFSR